MMTIGSFLAALTLALCALSPSVAIFAAAVILLEISSGMVQYQAAFAALVENNPRSASRNITYLTLIGGFASTIFWPISAALAVHLDWREIYLVFAGLNLFLCMPLHFWIMRAGKTGSSADTTSRARETVVGALPSHTRRRGMILVSFAFAILGFTLSAILAHMVPMLGTVGLGAAAVVIGSLFGPAQVLSRLINMIFGKSLPPPALAVLSAVLIVLGILILLVTAAWLPGRLPSPSALVWAQASTASHRETCRSIYSDPKAMGQLQERWQPLGLRWVPARRSSLRRLRRILA